MKVVKIHTSEGISNLDLDERSIAENIAAGYGDYITGDYVMHVINEATESQEQLLRFLCCTVKAGFTAACGDHLWALARLVAQSSIGSCITQDDYDLIDGILPPNPE